MIFPYSLMFCCWNCEIQYQYAVHIIALLNNFGKIILKKIYIERTFDTTIFEQKWVGFINIIIHVFVYTL